MPLPKLTAEDRRQSLPHGLAARCAKHFGVTRGHVSQVIAGIRHDPRVVEYICNAMRWKPAEAFPEYVLPDAKATSRTQATGR